MRAEFRSESVKDDPVTLLLAAHGSPHGSVNEKVRLLAKKVGERSCFDEVQVAFNYGTPGFPAALDSVRNRRVLVLPLMTSHGYFAREIMPRQIRSHSRADYHELAFGEAVGVHRLLPELFCQRLQQLVVQHQLVVPETSVIVVGHGTRRNPDSRLTTLAICNGLAKRMEGFASITAAFLDDDPELKTVSGKQPGRNVVVLPFLISDGPHFREDIPGSFEMPTIDEPVMMATAICRDKTIFIDRPMGFDENFADIVVDSAFRSASESGWKLATGTVCLVGAGPGAPELMTLAGRRLLRQADVLVHDRLIAPELLTWIRHDAKVIDVGKMPLRHKVPQSEICGILVREARAGRMVVRLKGGDPFVYGRGHEEVVAVTEAGLECQVVPGISSVLAGPAAAGIPVTARGIAASVAIMTGETGQTMESNKPSCAAEADTIVMLMGRRNLEQIALQLIGSGRDAKTPVACIENATLPTQRVVRGTLASISREAEINNLVSPMVTVIGDVAGLARIDSPAEFPLHGQRIAVVAARQLARLTVLRLQRLGAEVVVAPLVDFQPALTPASQRNFIDRLRQASGLIVTDRVSFREADRILKENSFDWRVVRRLLVANRSVAGEARRLHLVPDGSIGGPKPLNPIDGGGEWLAIGKGKIREIGFVNGKVTRVALLKTVHLAADFRSFDFKHTGVDAVFFATRDEIRSWKSQQLPVRGIRAICRSISLACIAKSASFGFVETFDFSNNGGGFPGENPTAGQRAFGTVSASSEAEFRKPTANQVYPSATC